MQIAHAKMFLSNSNKRSPYLPIIHPLSLFIITELSTLFVGKSTDLIYAKRFPLSTIMPDYALGVWSAALMVCFGILAWYFYKKDIPEHCFSSVSLLA
jgi:hypothetical protein